MVRFPMTLRDVAKYSITRTHGLSAIAELLVLLILSDLAQKAVTSFGV